MDIEERGLVLTPAVTTTGGTGVGPLDDAEAAVVIGPAAVESSPGYSAEDGSCCWALCNPPGLRQHEGLCLLWT